MVWYKASFPKTRATLFFHGKLLKSALKYGMLGEIVQGHLHGSLRWLVLGLPLVFTKQASSLGLLPNMECKEFLRFHIFTCWFSFSLQLGLGCQ